MHRLALAIALTVAPPALAFETAPIQNHGAKWMRDSVEFRLLTTQVFRAAETSVRAQAADLRRNQDWAVVLDIDETVLDNTTYFLARHAYGLQFDWESWDAWCERRVAEPIPGAQEFVAAVREEGGRVVWITNRHERTRQATVDNLEIHDMWDDEDILCLLTDDDAYTKRVRRTEARTGEGACAWEGTEVQVLAYIGDTRHDLPEEGEDGDFMEDLNVRNFIIPNAIYGDWEHGVIWYRDR